MTWAAVVLITIASQSPGWPQHISLHDTKAKCTSALTAARTAAIRKGYVVRESGCILLEKKP